MARSQRYKALEKELQILRRHLLPKRFSGTGLYSQGVYVKTFSYRVLAHAEFESFLEDRVRELYISAVTEYQRRGTISKAITSLIAFSGLMMEVPPGTITPSQPNQSSKWDDKIKLSRKIEMAANAFNYLINQNHGIKEKNILSLLLPVGIEATEIDNTWLSTIDSFGAERGIIAHGTGASYRTTQLPDPANELQRVKDLLLGFKDIDMKLNRLIP